jgi:transcription termination/antitermination protein NusA
MNKEFIAAIEDLEDEKGIPKEVVFDAIESALSSAYKKNYGANQNVRVDIDKDTGDIDVYTIMDVVEEVEDEFTQMSLEEAREIDPNFEVGDEMLFKVTPGDFGRIAAQTAKQVVVQRIREAERGMIFDDYVEMIGEVVTGVIHRKSNDTIFVTIGRTEGILSQKEQVPNERFEVNDRIKVYIMDVKKSTKGPQIFLSRSHPGLVKRLFELEVPEIEDGIVVIKSIAREAGSVGACVGARGSRVQNVVDALSNEKIDIINWSDDPVTLISNVLSPAKVEDVFIEDNEKMATVVVPDYQLSLAIGKSGQNVRLAAKLCGWKIDIKSHTQYYGDMEAEEEDDFVSETEVEHEVEAMDDAAASEEIEAEEVVGEPPVSQKTEADEAIEELLPEAPAAEAEEEMTQEAAEEVNPVEGEAEKTLDEK